MLRINYQQSREYLAGYWIGLQGLDPSIVLDTWMKLGFADGKADRKHMTKAEINEKVLAAMTEFNKTTEAMTALNDGE